MNNRNGLTARSVLIAITLMTVVGVWAQYAEFYTKVAGVSSMGYPKTRPPIGVFVAFMTVLMLGRWAVSRWRWAVLDRSEVLVIYCMLMVAVPVMATGVTHFLFPVLTGQSYLASVGNNAFQQEALAEVPSWFAITDARAAEMFWRGAKGVPRPDGLLDLIAYYLKGGVPWEHWWRPLLVAWLPMLLAIFVATLCIAAIMRRHWVEAERAPFPQTVMPLAIINADATGEPASWTRCFGSKVFWIGVAVPVILYGVNGLHRHFLAVPEIRTNVRLSEIITEKPWSAMATYWNFGIDPLAVGLACLITFEVSSSFLFFFALTRLELLWAELFGLFGYKGKSQFWSSEQFPFFESQCVGAAVSFALVALWMARRHIVTKVEALLRRSGGDKDEPMSTGPALAGILLSTIVFVVILSLAGMHWAFALVVFVMFVCFAITVAKLRAESGVGMHPFTEPLFFVLGGTAVYAVASLNVFNYLYLMCPGIMVILMAVQMESFRMCDAVGLKRRSMSWALVIAFVAAFVIGSYTTLTITHRYGMDKMTSYPCFAGKYAFSRLEYDERTPQGPDPAKIAAIGAGAVIAAGLTFLRHAVMSWPLHPIGYVLSVSRAADYWSSVLIAVLIKWALLKWGGLRMYEKATPAFIGLIFGGLAMHGLWAIIETVLALRGTGMAG